MKDEHRAHSLLPRPTTYAAKDGRLPVDQPFRVDVSGYCDVHPDFGTLADMDA